MQSSLGRTAASRSIRARIARCVALTCLGFLISTCAQAVVIRGRLTDALGKPVSARHGAPGEGWEDGRVCLCGNAMGRSRFDRRTREGLRCWVRRGDFCPPSVLDFYGGVTDVLQQDVVLAANTVRQEITVSATGIPTPLPQLTSPVSVIPQEAMDLKTGVVDVMRQTPGAFMVQTGQMGGVTSLFLRGGNSTANLVTIDGVPADDIGGIFDYGTVSSTAVGKIDVVRGPDSAMYGTDAGAGVVTIETPRGTTPIPQFNYEGSAGNLYTYQNKASIGGTWSRLDYFGAFSRIDTSNALPLDRYHVSTSAMNVGYAFNGNTQIRFTIRNADSVQGVPGAWDFQGVSQDNRQGDQDLYSGVTVENGTRANGTTWCGMGLRASASRSSSLRPEAISWSTIRARMARVMSGTW